MIILGDYFVCREDGYAYHITTKDNMQSIYEKGLLPKIGPRSKSVFETIPKICFYVSLYKTIDWIEEVYPNEPPENLELLRFNLRNRKMFMSDQLIGDLYLKRPVNSTRISYLKMLDPKQNPILLRDIEPTFNEYYDCKKELGYEIEWKNLSEYQLVKKYDI